MMKKVSRDLRCGVVVIFTIVFSLGYFSMVYSQDIPIGSSIMPLLKTTQRVPQELLETKSMGLYSSLYSQDELQVAQQVFQKTGIDAVGYFPSEMVFANKATVVETARYLLHREVSFLILFEKRDAVFSLCFFRFNKKKNLADDSTSAWCVEGNVLSEVLEKIYTKAINNQPRKNFLINSFAETDYNISLITKKRNAFFPIDLKVDKLAVPWFGSASPDSLLVRYFKMKYPFPFDLVDKETPIDELRRQGFLYRLAYVFANTNTARALLEYEDDDKQQVTPSASSSKKIYKFYVEHLVSGNLFLGPHWDADTSWSTAFYKYMETFTHDVSSP